MAFSGKRSVGIPAAGIFVTITLDDFAKAGREPNRGWPAYSILCPLGRANDVIRGPTSAAGTYRALQPKHGWVHGADLEGLTAALNLAGVRHVETRALRALASNFEMGRPLVNRAFTQWEAPPRHANSGDCRDWRLVVRLGGNASGAWSQRIRELSSNHPGVRIAAFRKVKETLRSRGKVGWPPSVATDAHPGFSVMAYQSGAILFASREWDSHILVLIWGGTSLLSASRWDTVFVARGPPILRHRLDMKWGCSPQKKSPRNMAPGRPGFAPRVFMCDIWDVSRNFGIWRLNRAKCVFLLPSMA